MIVDSSALIAVLRREQAWEELLEALTSVEGLIPAPVLVEYRLVASLEKNLPNPLAEALLKEVLAGCASIAPFTVEDAALASDAHRLHGRGNGRGGMLNMLDIMVYCMARRLDRPILCTGRDFASTDALIHPASRAW